jgi:DNA-binding SARP family transcriptional activator
VVTGDQSQPRVLRSIRRGVQYARGSREEAPLPDVAIEFRYLGGFALRSLEGEWQPGPPLKKGGELIRYLGIYSRRVATCDELAAAFWPGADPEDVAHRIHLAASGARTFLQKLVGAADVLRCTGNGYVWKTNVFVTSDAERFVEHSRRGTADGMRFAVDLYSGEFLAGEKADWLLPIRVKLACARACALEVMIEDFLARKNYAAALSYGLDLVESERGHEHGTRLVMQCFAALGQRTRAIEQYQLLKEYLEEQIGVEPTLETTDLAAKLLGGEVIQSTGFKQS